MPPAREKGGRRRVRARAGAEDRAVERAFEGRSRHIGREGDGWCLAAGIARFGRGDRRLGCRPLENSGLEVVRVAEVARSFDAGIAIGIGRVAGRKQRAEGAACRLPCGDRSPGVGDRHRGPNGNRH